MVHVLKGSTTYFNKVAFEDDVKFEDNVCFLGEVDFQGYTNKRPFLKDFIKESSRTCNHDFEAIKSRINEDSIQLLHASLGLSTEAGEFVDVIKKHLFYGTPVDKPNLVEELGDIFFYAALACRVLGVSFESVMEKNIQKLRVRYPDKFTEEQAVKRDLKQEREILER